MLALPSALTGDRGRAHHGRARRDYVIAGRGLHWVRSKSFSGKIHSRGLAFELSDDSSAMSLRFRRRAVASRHKSWLPRRIAEVRRRREWLPRKALNEKRSGTGNLS